MNNNNLNQTLQAIMSMKRSGRNPQQVMQLIMKQNPQYAQMVNQIQNMAQGRNPRDFVMQLARQNGVDDITLQMIAQAFDN